MEKWIESRLHPWVKDIIKLLQNEPFAWTGNGRLVYKDADELFLEGRFEDLEARHKASLEEIWIRQHSLTSVSLVYPKEIEADIFNSLVLSWVLYLRKKKIDQAEKVAEKSKKLKLSNCTIDQIRSAQDAD